MCSTDRSDRSSGALGIPLTHRTRPRIRPCRSKHIIDKLARGCSGDSTAAHQRVRSVAERIGVSQPGINGMAARSQRLPTPLAVVHRRL